MIDTVWPKNGAIDSTERRRVLLGITGSIAAYKAAELARLLVSWGYEVRVAMTESAQQFITTVTMASISGHPVATDFWRDSSSYGIEHIKLAEWADAIIIAPATADFIAKLAYGFADTPLLAIALACKAPLLVAPAMNCNMYENPKTQENIESLRLRGVTIIDPEDGAMACGMQGAGRLANPAEIFYEVRKVLSQGDYGGKRVLITTGPTREYLDPVRFISNRSSGKMGVALAREAFRRGAQVSLVHGPAVIKVPRQVRCMEVTTAEEMRQTVLRETYGEGPGGDGAHGAGPDVVVMAAAVTDFRPEKTSEHKIKKGAAPDAIKIVRNADILSELGQKRATSNRPVLVGFAVETGELDGLLEEARAKLSSKKVDLIVGNFAQDAFELDTNRAWLVDRSGRQEEIATTYKSRVANKILDAILRLW